MRPTILALDLEGTLISNAVSQIPRPGLNEFLSSVHDDFERLVLFTSVPEPKAKSIIELLAQEGQVPAWFARLDYTHWQGATKDLRFVCPELGAALLLDDHSAYVHPGQERWWIHVPLFASPYKTCDQGLVLVQRCLRRRLAELASSREPI